MYDLELQHAVAEELEWAPHVDTSNVAATVRDGIVQLTGRSGREEGGRARSLARARRTRHR
jgi:osmotically-inducible protein OsmY